MKGARILSGHPSASRRGSTSRPRRPTARFVPPCSEPRPWGSRFRDPAGLRETDPLKPVRERQNIPIPSAHATMPGERDDSDRLPGRAAAARQHDPVNAARPSRGDGRRRKLIIWAAPFSPVQSAAERFPPRGAPPRLERASDRARRRLGASASNPAGSPPAPGFSRTKPHSTVTLLARLRGLSTLQPRRTAAWKAMSCRGTTVRSGWSGSMMSGT